MNDLDLLTNTKHLKEIEGKRQIRRNGLIGYFKWLICGKPVRPYKYYLPYLKKELKKSKRRK